MSWRLYALAQLPDWSERWQQLHVASGASPLLHIDFVQPLASAFATGSELLAVYEVVGSPQAMTIVVPGGRGAWSTFQPPQAPLGIWLQHPDLALAPLLDALLRALPGCALMLGLTQRDPLLAARPAANGRLATLDYIDTASITLDGPFEHYWSLRGKNLRSNLKKQRARLERDGVVTRLECLRDPALVAAAVNDYGTLESAGWKAGAGSAVHSDNAQGRFYRAMLERFCRRNCASIYRYWFGQQLVAMDLCIEDGETIVVLKTSYDESVTAGLSPTLLMREQVCRALFDEARLRRIEFYGKVMDWHLRWTEQIRTLYHLNYYRWALVARLHQARRPTLPEFTTEQACISTK